MMNVIRIILVLCLVSLFISCSMQSRYSMLGDAYPSKPENYYVQVFQNEMPKRSFARISRLDVHLEKTHFMGSSLEEALPELKKQARLSGADAIIEIKESRLMVRETRIFHVTATGIRFIDSR